MSDCHCGNEKRYDYIIVGAGTAGLTAAWALTNKNKGKKVSVLVLEKGENLNNDEHVLDPTLGSSTLLTFSPKYADTPVTLQEQIYSAGRLVGGGSGHNGLQVVRGYPKTYNEWAKITGNDKWKYKNLLPLFISQEHYTPDDTIPNPNQRGLKGRLFITQEVPLTDEFSAALAKGFDVPLIDDYNDHYQISREVYANAVGVSANQDWITPPPDSIRSYSGNSYLYGIPSVGIPPIVDKHGKGLDGRKLTIITRATVAKIIFKNKVAIGVEVIITRGETQKLKKYYADLGVILSAGTIYTATILQLSGYGKRSDLSAVGIETIVNNENVGYNIINHYGPNALIQQITSSPPPSFKLNVAFTNLHPYLPNDPTERKIQTDFLYPGNIFFPPSLITALGLENIDSVAVGGYLLQSLSRGNVVIQSKDPLTPPLLNLNQYTDTDNPKPWTVIGSDAYQAVSYLKLLQQVAVAEGGNPQTILYPPNSHYPAPWGPAPDDSLLYNDAVNNSVFAYHTVGSCRMGKSKKDGVVNGDQEVFGVKNLYIADCSIEPLVQTGNTAYMAFFIGLILALHLGAKIPHYHPNKKY